MKAYHIFLLRHGMTQANREGKYVGSTDVPLSEKGKSQLQEMAEKYRYPQADLFFTSPLTRCRQTLGILYPESTPEIVQDLRECNFGIFEGKTINELKGNREYEQWASGASKAAPPQGESAADFQKRCCGAFEKIVDGMLRSGTQNAVIMAHGGTIMFILGTYGFPRRPYFNWMAGNGMGYEIVISPQLWMSAKAVDIAAHIPENAQEDILAVEIAKELRRENEKS